MNIVGHKEIREKLIRIVESGKIGHAYLFNGKSGIGKRLVALEFAKNIMCPNSKNGIACGFCEVCKTFGNNADFEIIEPEKNIIKVDAIRSFEEEVYLKPTISLRKCFIINDADLMNESAQNALLKILEEPPLYATIILVATNKEKLLGTIKSRVVSINFQALSKYELKSVLGENFNEEIIEFARGSVQKALELENENYINIANELVNVFKTKDFLSINKKIEEIKNDKILKQNISIILESVLLVCYNNLKNDISKFVSMIDIINETNRDIARNANLDLALDNMIVKICF